MEGQIGRPEIADERNSPTSRRAPTNERMESESDLDEVYPASRDVGGDATSARDSRAHRSDGAVEMEANSEDMDAIAASSVDRVDDLASQPPMESEDMVQEPSGVVLDRMEDQEVGNVAISNEYPLVVVEPLSSAAAAAAAAAAANRESPAEMAPFQEQLPHQPDAIMANNDENGDDNNEDDEDDDVDEDWQEDEEAFQQGTGRSPRSYANEYATIRELIAQTRRSMEDASGGNSASEFMRRDNFMQRFRRILFILHNRRRRLIRLGLVTPDTENSEGEAGAEGAGEIDDVGGADGGESRDGAETVAEADRLAQNLDSEYNNLEEIEQALNAPSADEAENSIRFDTNLPAEHSYMGANMSRVSGVNYLDVGQQYNMMLFMHQHVLFPGEVLPFMISGTVIDSDIDAQNGLLFGVCFPFLRDNENTEHIYGVTCQIYEKGSDERGNTLIKSRALQRFVTRANELIGPLEYIASHPQLKCYGHVKILPEIYLPEPLKCINMGSLNRFRDNISMQATYKRYQAASTPWPVHVYEYYSITSIVEKARTQLAQHKIDTMPTDPTQLSYWLVRNLHLSEAMMKNIFLTDSVNTRLKLIASTFKDEAIFSCRYCGSHIANCRELFAMSKHGVQTQYCNSAGYIHETNTVYQVIPQAISYSGSPSTEFSWFPGYQWHIIVCVICSHHIGWEFKAVEPNLLPKQFFGISSSSVRVRSAQSERTDARTRTAIYLNFLRLVGRE